MKTIKKITAIFLVLVMLSGSALGADTNVKEYKVSSLKLTDAVSKTGFEIQKSVAGNQNEQYIDPVLVACSDAAYNGTALKMAADSSHKCRVTVGFSTNGQPLTVIDMMLKPDISGTEAMTALSRPGSTYYYIIRFEAGGLYAFSKGSKPSTAIPNITVEKRWYHIQIALINEQGNKAAKLYVDGKLVKEDTSSSFLDIIDEIADTGKSFRFDLGMGAQSEFYIGDTKIYSPGLVQIASDTDRIVKNTDPVTVSFSRGVKPTGANPFGKDNLVIKDGDGNVITDAVQSVTPTADAAGFVTSAVLTFAPDKLTMDETYYIEATDCADIFGKAVASGDALDDVGGNSFIYAPYPFTLSIKSADRELDYLDETVTFELSEPIKVGSDGNVAFSKDNVIVTDSAGNPVALSSAEPVAYSDGRVTEVELTFAENALKYDGKYTVKTVGCVGLYNQPYEAPGDGSDSFVTLSAPFDYSWKSVKVYKGIGSKKALVSALSKGMISVEAEYANSGRLSEAVTLVCEVYEGTVLKNRFETVGRTLASKDSHKAVFGLWLGNVTSNTKINLTLKNSGGTERLTKKGAELFEN